MPLMRPFFVVLAVCSSVVSAHAQAAPTDPVPFWTMTRMTPPDTTESLRALIPRSAPPAPASSAQPTPGDVFSNPDAFRELFNQLNANHNLDTLPQLITDAIAADRIVVLPDPALPNARFGWIVCDEVESFIQYVDGLLNKDLEDLIRTKHHIAGRTHRRDESQATVDHHHVYVLMDDLRSPFVWHARELRMPNPRVTQRIPLFQLSREQRIRLRHALGMYLARPSRP